jgi:hypothetical protein
VALGQYLFSPEMVGYGGSMPELFDIYLTTGCRFIPDLEDLSKMIVLLANPEWRARLVTEEPGFLGLNLPRDASLVLLERLKYSETKALGMLVPIRYRDEKARVLTEAAQLIAEKEIERIKGENPNVKLEPLKFVRENMIWYTFASESIEWVHQGRIPGALFVSVDKLDGHVWHDDEVNKLLAEELP